MFDVDLSEILISPKQIQKNDEKMMKKKNCKNSERWNKIEIYSL